MKGKLALITGAAAGIGAASGAVLGRRGAKVIFADIDAERASERAYELTQQGLQGCSLSLDVTDRRACQQAALKVREEHGPISILVNNAGINGNSHLGSGDFERDWDRCISTNLTGMVNVTRSFLDDLKLTKGTIVNMASIVSFVGGIDHLGYTASKGGVRSLTQAMCRELAPFDIRVNAVAPGYVDTSMGGKGNPDVENWLAFHCPMKRHGRPEEIANAVSFLCSDDASYITGTTLTVDGGFLAV